MWEGSAVAPVALLALGVKEVLLGDTSQFSVGDVSGPQVFLQLLSFGTLLPCHWSPTVPKGSQAEAKPLTQGS